MSKIKFSSIKKMIIIHCNSSTIWIQVTLNNTLLVCFLYKKYTVSIQTSITQIDENIPFIDLKKYH